MLLTRRTNVLLSDDDYLLLKNLSKDRNVTVGNLIREAITKTHKHEEELSLREMLKKCRQIGKRSKITPADIKSFVIEGRKN